MNKTPTYFELMRWGPDGWSDELVFATLLTLAVALTSFLFGVVFRSCGVG